AVLLIRNLLRPPTEQRKSAQLPPQGGHAHPNGDHDGQHQGDAHDREEHERRQGPGPPPDDSHQRELERDARADAQAAEGMSATCRSTAWSAWKRTKRDDRLFHTNRTASPTSQTPTRADRYAAAASIRSAPATDPDPYRSARRAA